jgi:hypothetical protein
MSKAHCGATQRASALRGYLGVVPFETHAILLYFVRALNQRAVATLCVRLLSFQDTLPYP